MIRSLALLSLVAFAAGNDLWKSGLKVKFDVVSGFVSFPVTVAEAVTAGWVEVDPIKYSSGFDALSHYVNPKDTLLGLRFDENEQFAGVVLTLPKSIVTDPYYDMAEQGYTSWSYTINNVTVENWAISMFTVSEDAATRIAAYNSSEVIRSDYVTMQGLYGNWDKVPVYLPNLDSVWKEQSCIIWMGQHYFYNMTTSLSCDTTLYPWFLLYDTKTNQLIGVGPVLIKEITCDMEHPSSSDVKTILSTGPECVSNLVTSIGINTLHVYFINHPRWITC